jgi:GDPmannose 4,6-dehydratase
MHASNGILFNHESPIRGETFVTRKITRATARIALGLQEKLFVGNMSARRDWGHAKDYIKAMYLILQQDEPDDYVIATGITTEVREFIRRSFKEVGLELKFTGENENEIGTIVAMDEATFTEKVGESFLSGIWKKINAESTVVCVDPTYFRPSEVELLIGNPGKAKKKLGWEPQYNLDGLIEDMMRSDIYLMKKESYLKDGGYKTLNYFE